MLQTTEFGGTTYIGTRNDAVARISAAQRYSGIDKLSSVKLNYMRSVTGYGRLRFKRIK